MCSQYRIEERLGYPNASFRAVRRARAGIGGGGMLEARYLMAVHTRDEDVVARVIAWEPRAIAHLVGDAPAAQMLARAGIDQIRGGKVDAAVALLDEEAANAAPAELGGEREAGRPAAGDHDGIALCGWGNSAHRTLAAAFCAKLKSKTRAGATSLSAPPRLFWVNSIAPRIHDSSAEPPAEIRLT